MKLAVRNITPFAFWLFTTLSALALAGCNVKLVDDYDAKTYEEIIRIAKEVDLFYGKLLEQDEAQRSYRTYADQYLQLEAELRSLYIRNKSRPLNNESTQISDSILTLWIKYKTHHKEKDGYSSGNAKLDRKRFTRMFTAAASAESAKNGSADQSDTQ